MGFFLLGLAEGSIQLVPDGTLLLHIALVVLMVVALNRTLLTPINRILAERDRGTRGRLEEASRILAGIDEHVTRYERTLREARTEGYRLMELQRREAVREREGQIQSLKEETAQLVASRKEQIGRQAEAAREVLALEAQRLGLEIGSQILGRPSSEKPKETS